MKKTLSFSTISLSLGTHQLFFYTGFNIPPGVQLESYHFEELPEPVAEPASNHFCSIL